MLFVVLGKAKLGTMAERSTRRVAWQYPDTGAELVAEYWLQTLDPNLVVVAKADHITQLWPTIAAWDDVMELTVYPAVTAEEGLEVLKQIPPG
jgi:putative heme iron utilization protein